MGPQENNLQLAPAIADVRQFLYADQPLKQLAERIPEEYKHMDDLLRDQPELETLFSKRSEIYWEIADAVLLIRSGKYKQAIGNLESTANDKIRSKSDYWLALAYAKQQLGDVVGARNSIRTILTLSEMESRTLLNAWRILQELGDKSKDPRANQVLGVIMEYHVKNITLVAAYADGISRMYLAGGGGVMAGKKDISQEAFQAIQRWIYLAQPLVGQIPLEKNRQLPESGRVRFVVLTGGGIYVAEEYIERLERGNSPLSPLLMAADELVGDLFKLMMKNQK